MSAVLVGPVRLCRMLKEKRRDNGYMKTALVLSLSVSCTPVVEVGRSVVDSGHPGAKFDAQVSRWGIGRPRTRGGRTGWRSSLTSAGTSCGVSRCA